MTIEERHTRAWRGPFRYGGIGGQGEARPSTGQGGVVTFTEKRRRSLGGWFYASPSAAFQAANASKR